MVIMALKQKEGHSEDEVDRGFRDGYFDGYKKGYYRRRQRLQVLKMPFNFLYHKCFGIPDHQVST